MPDRKLDMPRRDFLRALGAAGLVVGFSPLSRHWIPAAQASGDFDAVPALDGEVRMDDASLASATGDNGFMRNLRPQAVLRPGSVDDVVTMVRWCHARRIAVAARGEAHTIFGQSQVDAGLSIDMRSLTTIHAIGTDEADVDAGVLWSELLDAALDHGRTPPVLTGFIALTVGGTLSVGGVSVRRGCGLQIDHVRRIQVVTGVGDLVWCSETEHSDLFEAVLGGLGQFGIITRAVVELVAAPSRSRSWVLQYVDPAAFFRDFQAMLASDRFHCVHGSVVPPSHPSAIAPAPTAAMVAALGPLAPTLTFFTSTLSPVIGLASSLLSLPPGAWIYQLTVTRHYEPGAEPSDSALLKGLSDLKILRFRSDQTYRDYILRVDVLVDFLKSLGLWHDVPHPWLDVFLPGAVAPPHITRTVQSLHFDDVGEAGLILLFGLQRRHLRRRLFKKPEGSEEWIFLFDILTSAPAPGANAAFVEQKLARNRRLYEEARALGGKVYVISALHMQASDWVQEYGANHREVAQLKQRFDPAGILTPTPGVFA